MAYEIFGGREETGKFLRKLRIIPQYDPVIPLLGMYPEDSPACNKNTCSTMFIVALFIISRS